jgi:hypothetical protein
MHVRAAFSVAVLAALLATVARAGGQDCPKDTTNGWNDATIRAQPRHVCNHNSKDMTPHLAKKAETLTIDTGAPVWTPLWAATKDVDMCWPDRKCDDVFVQTMIGQDGHKKRDCNHAAFHSRVGIRRDRYFLHLNELCDTHPLLKNNGLSPLEVRFTKTQVKKVQGNQMQCFSGNRKLNVNEDAPLTIVLTAGPPPSGAHWEHVPMWAIPCGWDTHGRATIMRLNILPVAEQLTKLQLQSHMLHHILHALGIAFDGAGFESKFSGALGREEQVTNTSALRAAARALFNCTTAGGLPLDDEFRLRHYEELHFAADTAERLLYTNSELASQYGELCSDANPVERECRQGNATQFPHDVFDATRRSHFESRVTGHADPASGNFAAATTAQAIASLNVSDVALEHLAASGHYRRRAGEAGAPLKAAQSALGCGALTAACNTSAGGDRSLFCFPSRSFANYSYACSADATLVKFCDVANRSALLAMSAASTPFTYFAETNADEAGRLAAHDFCPVSQVEAACEAIGGTVAHSEGGVGSRCFDAQMSPKASSAAAPTVGASFCLIMKCPFGARVQYRLKDAPANEWEDCPADGAAAVVPMSVNSKYYGHIECPAAADVCVGAVNEIPGEPAWHSVPSSLLEYGIVRTAATFDEAKRTCSLYPGGSQLGFIPTQFFGLTVLQDAPATGNVKYHVGMTGERSWVDTFGHQNVTVPRGAISGGTLCGHLALLNGGSSLAETVDCNTRLQFVCTRRKPNYQAPSVAAPGTPTAHRPDLNTMSTAKLYLVPDDATAPPAAQGAGYCTGIAVPFAVTSAGAAGWGAGLATALGLGGTYGLWTAMKTVQGEGTPAWSELVAGGYSNAHDVCYLLGPALTADRVLYPAECALPFPGVCQLPPSLVPTVSLAGLANDFTLYLVPLPRPDARALCNVDGRELMALEAPRLAAAVLAAYRSALAGVAHMLPLEAYAKLHADGARTATAIEFRALAANPAAAAATTKYLPQFGAVAPSFADAALDLNATTVTVVSVASGDYVFGCAQYAAPAPVPCATGTWCEDPQTDNRILFDATQSAGSATVDVCTAFGGLPLYLPPAPAGFEAAIASQFGTRALRLFATGATVTAGGAVDLNGTALAQPDVNGGLFDAVPAAGDCVAGYFTAGGALRYTPVPCSLRMPTLCRLPFVSSWVPFKAALDDKFRYEYALTATAATFAQAHATCASLDAALGFFNTVPASAGVLDLGSVLANLGAGTAHLWFGLQTPGGPGVAPIFNNTLNSRLFVDPLTSARCFTVKAGNVVTERTSQACQQQFRAVCTRSVQQITVTFPTELFAHAAPSGSFLASAPTGNSMPSASVKLQLQSTWAALTTFPTHATVVVGAASAASLQLYAACAPNMAAPEIASYTLTPSANSVALRTNTFIITDNRTTTSVWPCLTFSRLLPADELTTGVVEGIKVVIVVTVDLKRPGGSQTIDIIRNTLTCNVSQATLSTPTAGAPAANQVAIECTGAASDGVAQLAVKQTSCVPASSCPASGNANINIARIRFTYLQSYTVTVPAAPYFVGYTNRKQGTLKLNNDPMVPVTLTLSAGDVFLEPATFDNINTETHTFFFSSTAFGTFPVTLTVTPKPAADLSLLEIRTGAFANVASLFFLPSAVLQSSVNVTHALDQDSAIAYAGQPFVVTFFLDAAVFVKSDPNDADVTQVIGVDHVQSLFWAGNMTPAATSTSVTVSAATCCSWTMTFEVLPSAAKALADAEYQAAASNGASIDMRLLLTAAAGPHRNRFTLPAVFPTVRVQPVKKIRLVQQPTRLFANGGARIVVQLPQTPAEQATRLSMWCYNSAAGTAEAGTVNVTQRTVEWLPDRWDAFEETRVFEVTVAHSQNSAVGNGDDSAAFCGFVVDGPSNVHGTVPQVVFRLYPRTRLRFHGALPSSVLPGTYFTFQVIMEFSVHSDPPTMWWVAKNNATGLASGLMGRQSEGFGLPEVQTYNVSIAPGTAPARRVCLEPFNTKGEMFYGPGDLCFAVLPRLNISLVAPASYQREQPVGARNRQRVVVALSGTPFFHDVSIRLDCRRSRKSEAANLTVATFAPDVLTWRQHALLEETPVVGPPAVLEAWLQGEVTNEACRVSYAPLQSSAADPQLIAGSFTPPQLRGLFDLLTDPIVFVNLLKLTATPPPRFIGRLFVGAANKVKIMVALPAHPAQPVAVVPAWEGAPNAIDVSGSVNFLSANDTTSKAIFVEGLIPTAKATLLLSVVTNSGDVDPAPANVSFSVHPLIIVKPVFGGIDVGVSTVHAVPVYCGGAATAVTVTMVAAAPPENADTSMALSFNASSAAISTSPARHLFIRGAPLSNDVQISCATHIKTAQDATWSAVVTGPTEFAPGPTVRLKLQPLEKFIVVGFPTNVTIGKIAAFTMRPTVLPTERLELEFGTTCAGAIDLWDSGYGRVQIMWEGNANSITIPLIPLKKFSGCEIAITASPRSKSKIFEYAAFRGVLDINDPAQIIPEDPDLTAVTAAEFDAGRDFFFGVKGGAFAHSRRIYAATAVPTLPQHSVCAVVSSTHAASDPNSFFNAYKQDPSTLNVSTMADGRLTVRVQTGVEIAVEVREEVTFAFTRRCFEGDSAADPMDGFSNFTFAVNPPPPELESVQLGVLSATVAVNFAASLACGPAMATQMSKLLVLAEGADCPNAKWRARKQERLTWMENPFVMKIGDAESELGVFFGAVVFDSFMVFLWVTIRLFVAFFVFAYRRDMNVQSSTTFSFAMSRLRIPSIDLFVIMYFCPLITEFALRVIIYSSNNVMRTVCVVAGAGAAAGSVAWMLHIARREVRGHTAFDEIESNVEMTLLQKAYRQRGRWVVEQVRGLKFSMFYDDFMASAWYYHPLDLALTNGLGVVSAIEPSTHGGCVVKVGLILALFSACFLSLVLLRPFRHHAINAFFVVIAAAQVSSAAVSLAMIGGFEGNNARRIASITIVVIANLLLLRGLFELCKLGYEAVYYFWRKNKDGEHQERFVVEKAMTTVELFPHLADNFEEDWGGRHADEVEETIEMLFTPEQLAAREQQRRDLVREARRKELDAARRAEMLAQL